MTAAPDVLLVAGPGAPIRVEGAGSLRPMLRRLAPDWTAAETHGEPLATVTARHAEDGTWRVASTAYEAPAYDFSDGFEAASGLLGALIGTWVATGRDRVALHAAAIEMGGGLVLLLGDNFAGKSTLAVALAARGAKLYADDRIVLADGLEGPVGESLGLCPKLRLPLPSEADRPTRRFIAAYAQAVSADVAVLELPPAARAGFRDRAPVRRVFLLHRGPLHAGPPAVMPVGRAEATRTLLAAGFAPQFDGATRLARLLRLADRLAPARLDYADSFSAADWLLAGGAG